MLKTSVSAELDNRELVTESVAGATRDVNGIDLASDHLYVHRVAEVWITYHKTIAKITPILTLDSSSQFKNENTLLLMLKASLIVPREMELFLSVLHKYWV